MPVKANRQKKKILFLLPGNQVDRYDTVSLLQRFLRGMLLFPKVSETPLKWSALLIIVLRALQINWFVRFHTKLPIVLENMDLVSLKCLYMFFQYTLFEYHIHKECPEIKLVLWTLEEDKIFDC